MATLDVVVLARLMGAYRGAADLPSAVYSQLCVAHGAYGGEVTQGICSKVDEM